MLHYCMITIIVIIIIVNLRFCFEFVNKVLIFSFLYFISSRWYAFSAIISISALLECMDSRLFYIFSIKESIWAMNDNHNVIKYYCFPAASAWVLMLLLPLS